MAVSWQIVTEPAKLIFSLENPLFLHTAVTPAALGAIT